MFKIRPVITILVLSHLGTSFLDSEARAEDAAGVDELRIRIEAGNHDRSNTPIRFEWPEDRLSPEVRKDLDQGPVHLWLKPLERKAGEDSLIWRGQLAVDLAGPRPRATFLLPFPLRKGEEARFQITPKTPEEFGGQRVKPILVPYWTFTEPKPGAIDISRRGRPFFRYNASPVSSPNYKEIQNRDAYIHPAYSPSGALITGDFSPWHPHHRGFFLAYERTRSGDLTPDFWNIHVGTGKIHADGMDKPVIGPETARLSTRHRWDAKDKATEKDVTVLRERWDIELYDIPRGPYWLFDVTSTQQAVDRPFEVLPYRYGGMAYRGPEPFVKGTLDVLTSEGKHRKDGDQKPARWVDLTGPIAAGSDKYAGAMIIDHPSNPNYPNVARIHPTTLPFFCYVPAYDKPMTIAVDRPTVFRYRVMIHDGHPDPKLNESLAADFAEPPAVVVE